jgi:hypothetical protein
MELLTREPQLVDVPRDGGSAPRIFRCPTCQVAVFSDYEWPELRFVRGGRFPSRARALRGRGGSRSA